jgi:hypothetical protein
LIKADLHIHTTFSNDSEIQLEKLIMRVGELGLGCIAIADHGTTLGGLKLKAIKPPFNTIVAEEILTVEGEIIGFFLNDTIPAGLPAEEAIRCIHAQGGLACIPHPFDRFRSSAMQEKSLERIASLIDIVEVTNARTLPFQDLTLPRKFAELHHKPMGAGSDAHSISEIGRAYLEIDEFNNTSEFLKVISAGVIHPYGPNGFERVKGLAGRLARKVAYRH